MPAIRRFASTLAIVALLCSTALAQSPAQPPPDSPDAVRQMVAEARKEIEAYDASGAAAGAEHPARTWDRTLWAIHERIGASEAGALAAVQAVWLLTNAELWPEADARIASLSVDDPAWERLPAAVYSAGIERNDLPSAIDRLSRVAASTTKSANKAAALIVVGRAHRRQGNNPGAIRALQEAKAAAPDAPSAKEATGVIYEIEHLSPGLPAPAISAKARNGRTVSLASLRGKPVVLVFWGTT